MSRLKAELTNDPLGRGYAEMTAEQVATDLNTEYRESREAVSVPELNRHLLEYGLWPKINEAAEQTDQSGNPTDAARAADTLLAASVAPPAQVDLDSPGLSAALDSLVSADVITQTQREAIDALAERVQSRAAELGLGHVRTGDIERKRGAKHEITTS